MKGNKGYSKFVYYTDKIDEYIDHHHYYFDMDKEDIYKSYLIQFLREELYKTVIEIICEEGVLTSRQLDILSLYINQKTYKEISEILNITYTNIPHCLNGIKKNDKNKYYGGLLKKIKKIVSDNDKCKKIIYYINQINRGNFKIINEIIKEYNVDDDIVEAIKNL